MKISVLTACIVLFCSCIGQIHSSENKCDLFQTLEDQRILFVSQWQANPTQSFLCVVSEIPRSVDSLPTRIMSLYKKEGSDFVEIYKLDTPDHLVSLFPTQNVGGKLLTTWTGGSAYHFRVFAYVDGVVKEVLETGSRITPELIMDKDGDDLIVISDVEWPLNRDRVVPGKITGTSKIYKWNGKDFELIKKVPWEDRLKE